MLAVDRHLMEVGEELRWTPLTGMFILLSAWWVKGPLFVAVALVRDVRKRVTPVTAITVGIAVVLSDLIATLLKHVVDRHRPPLDEALIPLPGSPSFPSGHATTAFAAAAVIAVLCPRLAKPAFALAAFVALSRVYLGVHFTLDIAVGAVLGTLIGALLAIGAKLVAPRVGGSPELGMGPAPA